MAAAKELRQVYQEHGHQYWQKELKKNDINPESCHAIAYRGEYSALWLYCSHLQPRDEI